MPVGSAHLSQTRRNEPRTHPVSQCGTGSVEREERICHRMAGGAGGIGAAEQSRPDTSVPSDTSAPSATSVAILLSDSCCRPGRLGVVAFALVCAGMDPLKSEVGRKDLFGKELRFTNEAIADQLATAANAVMGNAGQSTPAAIIRDHGRTLSDFCGWVEGIEAKNDRWQKEA